MYWENVSSVPSDLNVYSTGRHSPSRVPTRRRARDRPSPGLSVTEDEQNLQDEQDLQDESSVLCIGKMSLQFRNPLGMSCADCNG